MFRSAQHDRLETRFNLSTLQRLNDPEICPDSHRTKAHIEIGETDPEETQPRPKHVPAIQASDTSVSAVTGRRLCNFIAKAADQMSQRVAAECIAAQQIHIDGEHDRADADAKWILARRRI